MEVLTSTSSTSDDTLSRQWENENITALNIAALRSFYKGDGRIATITLLRAIRSLLSSTRTLPVAVGNIFIEGSTATSNGSSSDSTV